ncbi:bifunctional 2-C-methyl-D-erythritol 4-phosphate cytidylyltransferase/2-C-methyl-D-erythritol 2,4-cyclodiphosphate synthase [Rhodobacteraceae bacterium RKSG542]|uniref:bifunctional 2-C-methyl-D-erythritol 4-phosphate cytidylyltransferase/2-C-methyl-D-erythritol 2,4-cyclodiphosphate synthase n=1 Tax=Pseudovibrio flavus TaxID=2529854 RepID=UPI0012BBC4B5|nr:bifunctional 2-C-methyl-D-erythritol 4-phosphate cytidylyltransferase/2-C-methyl-D-erythritol 2,4-cyclodiphosphate synthase [Pseudovibrio flavus]MTI16098.1 bifunctional 2-C-methyl-D-erythritol 4-phosphate cytidylyltransferase/2-C-methyl-D-erythritol 2,4-cyclodiphosphate synthase [Pseudovibrio flavus]
MSDCLKKDHKKVAVIIVAAGRGTRMYTKDDKSPKQYRELSGLSVLRHTVDAIAAFPFIDVIQPVIHKDDKDVFLDTLKGAKPSNLQDPVEGGKDRQTSVYNGLKAIEPFKPDYVLIHDGVRPFVTDDLFARVIEALDNGEQAVLPATPVSDTLKREAEDGTVKETVDRTGLWAAQTPQGFPFSAIIGAHRSAADQGLFHFTDDTALIEWTGNRVKIVEGHRQNIKITTPQDMETARQIVSQNTESTQMETRVGQGFDVHAFEEGTAVILGGLAIPHDKKLKGHSDADVALHALTDALFGAIADGDIGLHFPPSDPHWKGAESDIFLKHAVNKVKQRGGRIVHLDLTIICEAPKIGPHRQALRENIAKICGLPVGRVAVKATTSEKLGFTGRQEGIAAMASATVMLPFEDEE